MAEIEYCARSSFKDAGAKFRQNVEVGAHRFVSDAETEAGGGDTAPSPHSLLCAALATCTSMTVQMYASRKGWPLEDCRVEVHGHREGETVLFRRSIEFVGALTEEQRARLTQIADACPVHRTLTGHIEIETGVVQG